MAVTAARQGTAVGAGIGIALIPIVAVFNTSLYESIAADMNEEELEIAKSTPSFQLLPDAEPILQA